MMSKHTWIDIFLQIIKNIWLTSDPLGVIVGVLCWCHRWKV